MGLFHKCIIRGFWRKGEGEDATSVAASATLTTWVGNLTAVCDACNVYLVSNTKRGLAHDEREVHMSAIANNNNAPATADVLHEAALTAQSNGMWFNTQVPAAGLVTGPVSGDAITSMIAYDAAVAAVRKEGARKIRTARYVHTGFECGAL